MLKFELIIQLKKQIEEQKRLGGSVKEPQAAAKEKVRPESPRTVGAKKKKIIVMSAVSGIKKLA